jgi:nucleoside-diphosphate-sugar epimerase
MATYLITGVAGFIASRVAALLLDNGDTIIGIDNLNDAYDTRLKHWRLAQIQDRPRFTFHQIDIAQRNALNELALPSIDAVFNLAARAGVRPSVLNPWVYVETNVTGTLNTLEYCRERGINKYILASTSSLYGNKNPMPYQESHSTDHPLSPYAASKKAAEVLCSTYSYLHKIDVTVFRYFTVYGPAGRPDMSPFRFVQRIAEERPITVFGDGRQQRDFTYVDDIARGTIAGLKPVGYEIINLGSDTPFELMTMIRTIEEMVDREAQIDFKPTHPADMPKTWADISKAQQILGWRPQEQFISGLQKLVTWYKAERDWAKDVSTVD